MSQPFSPVVTVTFLDNLAATAKPQELDLPPEELAAKIRDDTAPEKSKLRLLLLGGLGDGRSTAGSYRFNANVPWISGVPGDYDREEVSFDGALAILSKARIFCILYTTPSHTPGRPRWRVLAFTSRKLPPGEHAKLVARLNGLFNGHLAVESFTLSQCYYIGRVAGSIDHRVEIVLGDCIDLRPDLDAGAIGKPNGIGPQAPGEARRPLDVEDVSRSIRTGAAYHTSVVRLAGRCAQQRMPLLEAQQLLEALFDDVFPPDRDQRWRDRRADIPRILLDIYGKEAGKRDAADYFDGFTINGGAQAGNKWNGAARADESEGAGSTESTAPEPEPAIPASLSLRQLQDAEFGKPDFLLGELVSSTSRIELVGPTGIGKSNLLFAMSLAIASGESFLHWQAGRPAKVLYLDGEMSARLLQARAVDAIRRAGGQLPDTLFFLSHALCDEAMQPLNFPAGQRFIDQQIELLGGIDLLVIDNVQSLLIGDMKDEMPWQQALPWVRDLTKRQIGQIWAHHTGHDESHGYGTKTREWQLDTVILMLREDAGTADIKFRIEFTKARERTPLNRADFEPRLITLAGDTWTQEIGESGRGGRRLTAKDRAYQLLCDAIVLWGEYPQPDENGLPPASHACIRERVWRQKCDDGNISEPTPDAQRQAFKRASQALINEGRVGKHGDWVWVVRK